MEQHRRKVFFEGLSSKTTTSSLETYLSADYQLKACKVPCEDGINKGYGFVKFSDERSVDTLMAKRPHRIDGKQVEIYRSVPHQGPLKEKKGVKNLIVSQVRDKLSRSDLERHFHKYGSIVDIKMNDKDDFCRIEFEDYDSVDKALLYESHTIQRVHITLKKGDRNYQLRANAKQIIDPTKVFYIHIENLSSKVDAENLSNKFIWPIYDILMRPVANESSLPTECWLKNVNSQQIADDFVKEWNGKIISGYTIKCSYEEDKKELCKFFRFGQCYQKDVCQWEHIMCPANRTCSLSDCRYGHDEGVKTTQIVDEPIEKYRIKMAGFQTNLTPKLLAQLLDYPNEKKCYVKQSENHIGYIVNLNTIKYARGLIERWHNKEIEGGRILKCQLELNIFPSTSKPWSDFLARVNKRKKEEDDSYHQRDCGFNRKESSASSTDSKLQLPSDELNNEWEIPRNRAEGNGEQVLLIRGKTDRRRLAVIKIYKDITSYNNELKALQSLKGINSVSQLIEYSSNRDNLWVLMERVPGCSLKDFIDRPHHDNINVIGTIKFVQNLLLLLKEVHSHGIVYRNLEPENIMINWDSKMTSIDQACLTLINFSQAYIKSDIIDPVYQQSKKRWYQAPQAHAEGFKYSLTIDTSGICAILLWLLTNINPRHSHDKLPHQQEDSRDKLEKKIIDAVETTSESKRNKPMKVEQLKTYLTDTFNSAFGYPDYQPWTTSDLGSRLESICEILSSTNPMLNTTELIFQELLSTANTIPSIAIDIHHDIFGKASDAFYQAKRHFIESNGNQYSWTDVSCTWMNTAQIEMNARQHDDILTFYSCNRGTSSSCSIIITCLATVDNSSGGNIITLSIGSPTNGQMNRIPIGQYTKNQNYTTEFKDNFIVELKNLIISICKQRKAIH